MISSYEVSSLIGQQQQMFSDTSAYASQSSYAGGFSYAGSETGYGLGNRIGMSAVNNAQGAFKAANFGIAAAGAYTGFKVGGASGAFRGAMLAGGPLAIAGMAAGDHVFGNMVEGAQQQQEVYKTLGANFQFTNSGSRTGRGFGRQDAKAISDTMAQLQSVPEMMTSMGELNRIMNSISQMGLQNGLRNAQEFNRKFKETLTTIKDVSKIMETTMSEATQYLAQARQSGYYSNSAIRQNAAQRQFTSGVTGMNQDQIGQIQMMGSMTNFAMGGGRATGASSALRTARQIGMANEMGIISNDRIAELTGQEGAAGIQSMTEALTGAAHRMSRGGLGTAMSIALAKQENGRFTGEMDMDLVEKVRSGGISKSELLSLAHKKASSRNAKISFAQQKDKLRANMASTVGAEGIGMELKDILGGAGWSNPDAVNLVMQRFGVDENQARIIQEMGKNLPEIQKELGSRGQTEGRRMAEQAHMKENSLGALKAKFMKKMENTFSEPFKKMGADMSNAVGQYVDDYVDSFLGRYSTTITKETSNIVSAALGGGKGSQAKFRDLIGSSGKLDLSPGAVSYNTADTLRDLSGNTPENMKKYEIMEGLSKKGLAFHNGEGFISNRKETEGARKYFGDLQKGILPKSITDKILNDDGAATSIGNLQKQVGDIIKEHGADMKEMSQMDRVKFIKDKIMGKWLSSGRSDLISLQKQGISTEDIIAFSQHGSKTHDNIGAVNFNKLSGELFGTGEFGSAEKLGEEFKGATRNLSSAFGEQSSQVAALLGSDSKSRDLFLKATGGDEEAQRLLTKELPLKEREQLMSKYGVTEGQLSSLTKMYGGAGGKRVSGLTEQFNVAKNRSSLGGLAAQLRRQGADIGNRLGNSKISGPIKDVISSLAGDLSGLTDVNSLQSFVSGKGNEKIDYVLSSVSGLKGKEREEALETLGEGAKSAFNFGDYVSRQAQRGKGVGLNELKGKLSPELWEFAKQKSHGGGALSKKDAEELGRMARNSAYGGSLSAAGSVHGKDVEQQTKMAENLNKFAQTTASFAQLVISATPQLSDQVKKAAAQTSQDSNIVPPK